MRVLIPISEFFVAAVDFACRYHYNHSNGPCAITAIRPDKQKGKPVK